MDILASENIEVAPPEVVKRAAHDLPLRWSRHLTTYAYQCEECGEIFDVHASIKEKQLGLTPECPACHETTCRQVLTSGFWLRGRDGANLRLGAGGSNCGPGCCGR